MEEPKAPEASAAAASASQPPPTTTTTTTNPSSTSLPPTTKKRPLESDAQSNYFKIRAVIRDLRPHVIEVLRTPDYKNCKASQEIREQLKIVVKLYDNMKADAVSLGKSKQDGQNLDNKTQQEQQPQHVKSPEQIQVEKSYARSSEIKVVTPALAPGLQKLQADDGQGTYVVGGSAFGWNFITFSGKDAVYYGRTKEQYRSAQVTQSPLGSLAQ